MSKYKKLMLDKGIMQKELLDSVRRTDNRVDKSLLSKIVNDICLPTPKVLESICNAVKCDVLDIYEVQEVDLLRNANKDPLYNDSNAVAREQKTRGGGLSHGSNIYNLTVEINREVAERLFSKQALRKLGYLSKTDCIRQLVYKLDKKYQKVLDKEKTIKAVTSRQDG